MADHLLVESQGGWTGPGTEGFLCDALAIAEAGHRVWLLLIENGVTVAVGDPDPRLRALAGRGGQVWVDGFSLAERGLCPSDLDGDVTVVDMDAVAAKLLEPDVRAVWH